MSDDDNQGDSHVEATVFNSEVDGPRYAKIGMKVCELLQAEGLNEVELIPFLGFYLAHVMDCHLGCDTKMFRNNMLEFGNFTIEMFHKMTTEGDDEAGPAITH